MAKEEGRQEIQLRGPVRPGGSGPDEPVALTRRQVRDSLWRVNALAALTFAVVTMSRPLFSVFAAEDLGAGATGLGVVAGAYALVPLFLSLPVGGLISRWGERPLMVAGSAGLAGGLLLAAASLSLPWLVAASLVAGMAQMLMVVCTQTLVTSLGEPREREQYLAWFTTATSAGQLVGPLGGGFLADHAGFRATFAAAAVLCLGGILLARRVHTPPTPGKAPELRAQAGRARELLALPEMRLAILAAFSLIFSLGVNQSFYSVYVTRVLGFSTSTLGMLLAVRAVMALAVRAYMRPLVALAGGRYRVLFLAMVAGAVALGATPLLRDVASLTVAAALLGVATGLTMPLSMLAAANSVPAAERGLAMGVRLTGNRLAELSSPLLFGPLAEWVGLGPAFHGAGALLLGAALLSLRWRHGLDDADRLAAEAPDPAPARAGTRRWGASRRKQLARGAGGPGTPGVPAHRAGD
ncbi:major facilitator superfamily MFS_1 [Thermaerobacter marianensis DSM 12885]|uniref:Major facilitator superfamily MFS_1 n=1 Tax=Thermaerobacter marianensis (strain ATCC 700841 / DSM 12885 / JCM 10246 / 7p75a) TaxID=644966 RepID=E6SLW2_THEM7|nr:MFS transporter [Thermaerobacter marianensis]ADU51411.1 major facilitator superfamily MFS_1 [Thermaerobacter marianensis DSM 12885]